MNLNKRGGKGIAVIGFLASALLVLSICPGGVNAHAPAEVKIAYDLAAQTLTATVTHTRFSDSHYVVKVEIMKNGAPVSLGEYKNQPAETFTYTYNVAAAAGDTLEVTAVCNKFGSKKQKLTVAGP
jgi:hypothetical protein